MRRTQRVLVGVLASVVAMGSFAAAAQAQAGRQGRKQQKTPFSEGISEAMDDLEWGMSKQQLLKYFIAQVKKKYRPKLSKAPGAIEEDRLRHRMNREIKRIRDSYVEFKGQTTGWDVSFLGGEYTHGNGEAMLVVEDARAKNFFFLINNRFWKWYRAFKQDVFAGASFGQFAGALQKRFGKARGREGKLYEWARHEKRWLEWQDKATRLRAVDETEFYGFYCLVFEEKDTVGKLDRLRSHPPRQREQGHALVDSVTSGEGDKADPDSNPDIVDRITGKIRRRQDAPED